MQEFLLKLRTLHILRGSKFFETKNALFIEAKKKKSNEMDFLIKNTLLEIHMRRNLDYQLYKGNLGFLLGNLDGVQPSFDPRNPLTND